MLGTGHRADGAGRRVAGTLTLPKIAMESPVGPLVLSERDGHLVAVAWAEAAAIPEARRTPLLTAARDQLERYFAGLATVFDLPLAPAGTEFQRRVWRAMIDIPAGETASYGGLAATVGSSPRAIGNACGTNPIPIIVPCHRVVAGDGRLGGYSGGGGPATKRYLLGLEGVLLPL